MAFLILFLCLAFVFILLLLGGSVLIQSWIYNVPADNIVVRALATGGGIAVFYTLWCFMDAASPGRYDSVFESADLKIEEYNEIISLKKTKTKEEAVLYRKNATGTKVQYFRDGDLQKTWSRSDSEGMVTAILIKEKGNVDPTRFEIKLVDGKLPNDSIYYETDGRRYINAPALGKIVTPRSGSFFLRAFAMALHLAIWVVALWLGMQYVFGHALGLAFGLWILMTFGALPILFNKMRDPSPTATPPAKVQLIEPGIG